jgi:hypothetical protein
MGLTGRAARMKDIYKILVGKPEGNVPNGRLSVAGKIILDLILGK